MKKSCFFVFLAFLFIVSCSNGDEPLIPCVTVSDCPDSSYSCFDGFCVHAGAVVDPSDPASGDTLPDGETNDGNSSSDNGNNNNDDDSSLPDPGKPDDDGNSESQSDKDSAETPDSDGTEGNDSSENPDVDNTEENDGETNDGNGGDDDADSENGESDPSLNDEDADTDNGDSDADADVDNDADHDVEPPTEPAACAAAIAALPHGGKYDWDDGTTQGFSTNTYWNLVESSVIAARSGSYSFGKYSQYTVNKDQISPLLTATDLSACKVTARLRLSCIRHATVKAIRRLLTKQSAPGVSGRSRLNLRG